MNEKIKKLVFFGIMLGLGYALPFLTQGVPVLSKAISPMHYPVIVTGFVLGPIYGLALGLLLPISRSLIFGMPVFYPMAITMSAELLGYGLFSGLFYKIFKKTNLRKPFIIIFSLILALIIGKFMYGLIMLAFGLYPLNLSFFNLLFIGTVVRTLPALIIELLFIPIIILILEKSNLIK